MTLTFYFSYCINSVCRVVLLNYVLLLLLLLLDLYLLKMYFIPKMNFLGQKIRKLEQYEQTDQQTDATECIITAHSRVATIS